MINTILKTLGDLLETMVCEANAKDFEGDQNRRDEICMEAKAALRLETSINSERFQAPQNIMFEKDREKFSTS